MEKIGPLGILRRALRIAGTEPGHHGPVPRVAVLSDLHSNLEALESVLAEVRAAGVERVVVCGDIVGYGADPSAVLERVYELPLVGVVAGNHDLAAVGRAMRNALGLLRQQPLMEVFLSAVSLAGR